MYNTNQTSLDVKDISKYFHNYLLKSDTHFWLNEHNTKVIKQTMRDMFTAYDNFFKHGSGFPKFKCKSDNEHTCRFPIEAISKKNNYQIGKLTLTTELKNVKFRCSKEYRTILTENKENIKSATLTKNRSGEYILSFLVDVKTPTKQRPTPINDSIGVDVGIKTFVTTSKGQEFENLKIKRTNQNKLAKLHRSLSKKEKGSKNREKARIKLAKLNQKLTNQKTNYLHHVTNTLINENQVISIETLNVEGMLQNHNLARSIQEVSFSEFFRILKYKALWYDRTVIQISQWFPSSKKCNLCDFKNTELTLNNREWICPECGANHDRDVNASINIEKEGLRLLHIQNSKDEIDYIYDTMFLPLEETDNQPVGETTKPSKLKFKRKIGIRSAESTPFESKSLDPR